MRYLSGPICFEFEADDSGVTLRVSPLFSNTGETTTYRFENDDYVRMGGRCDGPSMDGIVTLKYKHKCDMIGGAEVESSRASNTIRPYRCVMCNTYVDPISFTPMVRVDK